MLLKANSSYHTCMDERRKWTQKLQQATTSFTTSLIQCVRELLLPFYLLPKKEGRGSPRHLLGEDLTGLCQWRAMTLHHKSKKEAPLFSLAVLGHLYQVMQGLPYASSKRWERHKSGILSWSFLFFSSVPLATGWVSQVTYWGLILLLHRWGSRKPHLKKKTLVLSQLNFTINKVLKWLS